MASLGEMSSTTSYPMSESLDTTTLMKDRIHSELGHFLKNSIITIDLKHFDNSWHANVVIDSNRGFKASRRKEANLEDLIQNVISDLRIQFELTEPHHRRQEIFLFDHQREYDHFTETLSASPFDTPANLKVLVIEDDPTALLILERSMKSKGCHVDLVKDPETALDKVKHQDYDLVILDWCLPYMDGYEFLKKADKILAQRKQGVFGAKSIPLVICSSKNSEEINLPLVSNFLFCEYWNKKLPFSTVISSIEAAIKSARQHKTKVV
jgi:CheY-like chemotaxis protein